MNGSDTPAARDRSPPGGRLSSEAARILIVDDEPLVRAFVGDLLLDAGYEFDESGSLHDAIARLRRGAPLLNAAIIDLVLPDGPGTNAVTAVRALHPRFPIVLTTGQAITDLRQHYAFDPDMRVMAKPFAAATLLEHLRSLGVFGKEESPARPAHQR